MSSKRLILLASLVTLTLPLSGCLAASIAGNVVEGAVNVTGGVVGGAIDVVTTSDEEQMKKDWKKEKKAKKKKT